MDPKTSIPLNPAGKAWLEGVKNAAANGASPPVAPLPPSRPSGNGSSGGGSGSSGGGGNSGSGHNSSASSGGKRNNEARAWAFRIKVLTVAAVVVMLGIIYLDIWRTSPEGVKLQHADNDLQIEMEKTKQKELEVKLVRERTRQLARARYVAPQISQPQPTASSCIVPAMSSTKYSEPLRLSPGQCLKRAKTMPETPADYANFWVVFTDAPKSITGVADIIEFVPGRVGSSGKRIPVERSRCTTSGTENCIGYLQGKLNIPLAVFNTTSDIHINM